MATQLTRIFNADVKQPSIGNAGPDAIEQDLDNLYANKAWKDDVLIKTNATVYTPTQNYHPATKKYVDDSKQEVTDALDQNVTNLNNRINTANTDIQGVATDLSNFMAVVNGKFSNMIFLDSYIGDGVAEGKVINFSFVPAIIVIQDNSGTTTNTHIVMKDTVYKINSTTAAQIGNGTLTVYGALNETGREYRYIFLIWGQIQ